jgi:hypothetical protein
VGEYVRRSFVVNGAHKNSWARPDTASNYGRLGWIRETRPVAHILELGFIQGNNSEAHLRWLAELAAAVMFEAFTGRSWNPENDA